MTFKDIMVTEVNNSERIYRIPSCNGPGGVRFIGAEHGMGLPGAQDGGGRLMFKRTNLQFGKLQKQCNHTFIALPDLFYS